MLKEIIDFINCNIKPLGLTGKLYGLCELIEDDKKVFPIIYDNGENKKIFDIDYNDGLIYHRVKVSYSESEDPDASVDGCDRMVLRTYPMRCVCVVKKDKKEDNNYSDQTIAGLISKNIVFRNDRELRRSLRLDTLEANVTSVSVSKKDVFDQEFKNIEPFIDFEYALIAIDYNLIIGSEISCLANC